MNINISKVDYDSDLILIINEDKDITIVSLQDEKIRNKIVCKGTFKGVGSTRALTLFKAKLHKVNTTQSRLFNNAALTRIF